jgi:hypothetical protein
MRVTAPTASPNMTPLPSCGLPAWAVVELDGMLAAGILESDEIAGLSGNRLYLLALESVRARHRGVGFDITATVEKIREGSGQRVPLDRHDRHQ